MKYIMIGKEGYSKYPIVFPEDLWHSDVAERMLMPGQKVLSAEFVNLEGGTLYSFGESPTLRIKSDPEDVDIIKRYFRP